MKLGLPPDLLPSCWGLCGEPLFRGSYAECSDVSYCSDVQGKTWYLLTTLLEVCSIVAAWEQAERSIADSSTSFAWSYTIHARISGRIILHISYQIFSEE